MKKACCMVIKFKQGTADFNPRWEGQGGSWFNQSLETEQRDGAGAWEQGLWEELGPGRMGGQPDLELQEPATTPPPRCPLSPERGDNSLDSGLMLPLLSHQCLPLAEPSGK